MINNNDNQILVPFLKWAGGKRWLVADHINLFPKQYNRYIEPFLGSAAAFFALQPKKAILSDINNELINTYIAIRSNAKRVEQLLTIHQQKHSQKYYYAVRQTKPKGLFQQAARFIYLNRTCWNGLYRVNLDGKFNVPIGTKTNVLLDSDNFSVVAECLNKAKLLCRDFEEVVNLAAEGDLIFVDPPYTVKHNYNGFVKYNEKLFCWNDQIRLRDSLVRARKRGAFVVVTNANHPSVRELYRGRFELITLARSSVIAASSERRGRYTELIIRSFP